MSTDDAGRRARPCVEQLESRLTPHASFQGNVLVIDGTDGADVIRIEERGGVIRVRIGDEPAEAFARTAQTTVRVEAGGGNDRIIGPAGSTLALIVDGGSGSDTIEGGSGDDDLDGGGGNDEVRGGGGDDVVAGGDGNDVLFGDAGNDVVLGGSGNDSLEGGGGADLMDGGTGNDSLAGGGGPDILNAGTGVNSLSGGNGRDRFITVDEFNVDVNRLEDFQPGVDRRKTTFSDPFLMGARTDLFPGAPPVGDRRHLEGAINYATLGSTNPPTFGPHHPAPLLPTGVFGTAQDDADLVHNLEHGHVRIIYDPARLSAADVAALQRMVRQFGPKSGLLLTPRLNNPTPVAATSWAHLITLDRVDLRLLRTFIMVNRGYGPEGYITP